MKTYKVKALAASYGVHRNTFGRWLKRNPNLSHLCKRKVLFDHEYRILIDTLGPP